MIFKIFSIKHFFMYGVGIIMVDESRGLKNMALSEMGIFFFNLKVVPKTVHKNFLGVTSTPYSKTTTALTLGKRNRAPILESTSYSSSKRSRSVKSDIANDPAVSTSSNSRALKSTVAIKGEVTSSLFNVGLGVISKPTSHIEGSSVNVIKNITLTSRHTLRRFNRIKKGTIHLVNSSLQPRSGVYLEKHVYDFTPFIHYSEPVSNPIPSSSELLTYPLKKFIPKTLHILLDKNTPINYLPKQPFSYNIKLSPIFDNFDELSHISQRLFSMVNKLEFSARIIPVALYHPSKNKVAILEGSLLSKLHLGFKKQTPFVSETIEFKNGFKPPIISIYSPKKFKQLFAAEKLIDVLNLSSFTKSKKYPFPYNWNIIFISVENYIHKSTESITLSLFREIKLFRNLYTKVFQYNEKNWSYELLSEKTPQGVTSFFNSHPDLIASIKPLRWLLGISDQMPISITAMYNGSSNSLVVSSPKTSLFGKLIESLKTSPSSILTIGEREVPFDNIIFSRSDALSHILSKNTSGFKSKIVHLEDAILFNNPLNSHKDSWVPIMISIADQSVQKRTSTMIPPEIHIFDKVLVNKGSAKEVFSPRGEIFQITLENYNNHILRTSGFLSDLYPNKFPRRIYNYTDELFPFISEVSLSYNNLIEEARPHLGDLIASGAIEYNSNGLLGKVIVIENTQLANMLRSNPDSYISLLGKRLDVKFINTETIPVFPQNTISRLKIQDGNYSFDMAQNLKLKGFNDFTVRTYAFLEHRNNGNHMGLIDYSFPIYPIYENLVLVSKGLEKRYTVVIKTIAGEAQIKIISFITKVNKYI